MNKRNKKIAVPLMIAIFALGIFFVLPSVASATTVEIGSASARPDTTTTTTITAYDIENLGNFGITVTFDPDVVNVTDITGGPDVGEFLWERVADNQVRLYTLNLLTIPSLSGDVLLATLTLHAVGNPGDTSPLNLEIGLLLDHDNNPISATPVSGTFEIPAAAPVQVEISDASASPDAATTTTIVAQDVENLGNFGITVSFDHTVVNVTDVTKGPDVGTFAWKTVTSDSVRVYTLNLGITEPIPSLSGDVTLATLTLKAVGAEGDTSPLNLEIGLLLDHDNNPISATPVNGTFEVSPTPTPTPTVTPTPSPTPPVYRRGGGGGAPKDTDGDGYSDIQEMLAGTDKDDPCDPNPECAACLASKPAATPTPTAAPTAKPTTPPAPTPKPTAEPTPTPTPTEEPGFEAVFAIAGLLAVAYLVLRRRK